MGAPQNYARAMDWFRLAGYHENIFAIYHLALMYANGLAVPKDNVTAYALCLSSMHPSEVYPEVAEKTGALAKQLLQKLTPGQRRSALAINRDAASVGTINAIDDYAYALTGQTYKGSGDPMLLPRLPPMKIRIGKGGQLHFADILTNEVNVKRLLQMDHYRIPRSQIQVIIDGEASDPVIKKAVDAVLSDAKLFLLHNLVIQNR